MKLFIASAAVHEIRWARDHGLIDGVLTTPAMLAAQGGTRDPHEQLDELCRAFTIPVAAAVAAADCETILRDGRELARLSDRILVQIPFVEDAILPIRRLSGEGIKVGAMLVFNAAQAILAAKAGAVSVIVQVEELETHGAGTDGADTVATIRDVFERQAIECDVLAAFPRNAAQFTGCARAGAHAIAVTGDVLRALLLHPLTDRGLDQFLTDLSRRPRSRPQP